MDEYWGALCSDYAAWESAEPSEERSSRIEQVRRAMVNAFRSASAQQKDSLRVLLGHPDEDDGWRIRHFAAAVLWNVSFAGDGIPEVFFEHLVDAAVAEDNLGDSRYYVEPSIMAFGKRRTVAELERRRELSGNSPGIEAALYWTGFTVRGFTEPESKTIA
jgi:hypothetical protein